MTQKNIIEEMALEESGRLIDMVYIIKVMWSCGHRWTCTSTKKYPKTRKVFEKIGCIFNCNTHKLRSYSKTRESG